MRTVEQIREQLANALARQSVANGWRDQEPESQTWQLLVTGINREINTLNWVLGDSEYTEAK